MMREGGREGGRGTREGGREGEDTYKYTCTCRRGCGVCRGSE